MTYRDRCEAEAATGHPAWPCPHCGHDVWAVERPWRKPESDHPCLFPAVCGHCHILEDAHHVDGNWMGQHMYSKSPASLCDFVREHSEWLKETNSR